MLTSILYCQETYCSNPRSSLKQTFTRTNIPNISPRHNTCLPPCSEGYQNRSRFHTEFYTMSNLRSVSREMFFYMYIYVRTIKLYFQMFCDLFNLISGGVAGDRYRQFVCRPDERSLSRLCSHRYKCVLVQIHITHVTRKPLLKRCEQDPIIVCV